jgi:DNA-binding CsgD family transcriptional regulator
MVGSRQRVHDDVVRLLHRGLDVREFSLAAARTLRRAVPFDGVCVLTVDPATGLPTGELVENGLPDDAMARLTEIELLEADFNKFADLARRRAPAASLSAATGGELDRSVRQRELRAPSGFGDELRAVVGDGSSAWGAITLLREEGRPDFTAREVALVASLSGPLAEGVRRGTLLSAASDGAGETEAGLLLLREDGSIESASPAAEEWLEELLPDGDADRLPVVVAAVAARARAAAGEAPAGGIASARVRTAAGRWLLVRGTVLGEPGASRVAVILEAARSPELAQLVAGAYGLSERERHVTQLVARGLSTEEIAGTLHLAPWTVQDHLKSIFAKTGVSSRGALVARLFFEHYAPRLTRDPLDALP